MKIICFMYGRRVDLYMVEKYKQTHLNICHLDVTALLLHLIAHGPQAQHMDMVTLMPRFPLSANSWAMLVSNTRQSELRMAEDTPSCIDLGVASQVSLRR